MRDGKLRGCDAIRGRLLLLGLRNSPAKGNWGWRAEGHHVSVHFTVVNGSMVAVSSPTMFGSNPAEVREGPKRVCVFRRSRRRRARPAAGRSTTPSAPRP